MSNLHDIYYTGGMLAFGHEFGTFLDIENFMLTLENIGRISGERSF